MIKTKSTTTTPEKIKFLFDTESRRPACVLIQALYGGDRRACLLFREWETNLTRSLVMVSGTIEEIGALAKKVNDETKKS